MSSEAFARFTLQVAIMLATAVAFGRVSRRLGQPAVVGEMFGGLVLGPTLLGWVSPNYYEWLFLSSPAATQARDALSKTGMLCFMFCAGRDLNLSELRVLGRKAVYIGLIGTLIPMLAGVGLVYIVPRSFWGVNVEKDAFAFALFIGMNLANSANPVIARILTELEILKRQSGLLTMAATSIDDIINWALFALLLSEIVGRGSLEPNAEYSTLVTTCVVTALVAGCLYATHNRPLECQTSTADTTITTSLALVVLLASSVTESVGLHSFVGAFAVGVLFSWCGDHYKNGENVISKIGMTVAPIYFISLGMTANLVRDFDPVLVATLLAVACVSKIGGVMLGAKLAKLQLDREMWAVAVALNARGATGIILAGIGHESGLIDGRVFVAVVVMALVTSLMAGPLMSTLLSYGSATPQPKAA